VAAPWATETRAARLHGWPAAPGAADRGSRGAYALGAGPSGAGNSWNAALHELRWGAAAEGASAFAYGEEDVS